MISTQPFVSIALSGKDKDKCERLNNNISHNNSVNVDPDTANVDNNNLFYVLMIINLVASSFDGSTIGFIDSGVIQIINTRTKKTTFGIQRLFGAPGLGLGTFISSILVQYFPKYDLPCYSVALFAYGFITLCLAINSNILYRKLSFGSPDQESNAKVRTLLSKTLRQFHVIFFLVTVLVTGTIHGFYLCYLFILIKEINSSNVIMGLAILTGALSAIIVLYFLEKIIKVLGGTMEALFVGCFSWSIRLLLTSFIENPYLNFPLQLFQAFGFALFLGAGVTHVKLIAPRDIYTSMYGLFNVLFYGMGMIIVNVTGAIFFTRYMAS